MFSDATGVHLDADETILPPADQVPAIPRKEILRWERELVGIYVSEHPLARVMTRLDDVLSGSVGTLSEERSGQQVTVAGMVQRVYRHITKKGNEMAFVTLEDMQGSCDVVVFPGVWSETKDVWQPEQIVVVNGKVDASRRDEPNLLCSWVKRPQDVKVAAHGDSPPPGTSPRDPSGTSRSGRDGSSSRQPPEPPASPPRFAAAAPQERPAPPPSANGPRRVRVTLRRTNQQAQDKRMLRQIHDTLIGYDGQDDFVIHLADDSGGGIELRFPNHATACCPKLLHDLEALVGKQGVQIEEGV
jgi:DNA polymerase-3 subunit alpha